jgi:regulator of protease activity HflC (stomatin/prohibitin superfamily)
MERNLQRNGLVNLIVLLLIGVAAYAVARSAGVLAGQVATVFLGLGVLVTAVSWFQMRLEERERLEKLELDEIARGRGSEALFGQEAESFPARRAREQFEKFFVPGFSVVLCLVEGLAAFFVWRWLQKAPSLPFKQPLVAMGLMGLFALVLFLMGKYSSGLARLEGQRLLRPSSSYLLLGAYLCALVVADVVAYQAEFNLDRYVGFALCAVLALLAAEALITLVLEIFRPRVKGRVAHLVYGSRLVGLLSHPEGLFTTAAHVLDYQFGFKVSETWFYRFLEEKFPLLLLGQFGLLLLSTCFFFVEIGEQALLERFGQPVGQRVIGPGWHLKLPWPIDQVHRYRTDRIQTFAVGFEHEEHSEAAGITLWTVSHTKEEFLLLVASRDQTPVDAGVDTDGKSPPVNLLAASIPVQYQITNLLQWAYQHRAPEELLKDIGTREVVRYLVNADVQEVTSSGRFAASEELRRRIQERAEELGLGAKILFVGLQDIHPPVKVASAYEEVVSARHKREATLLEAQAHQTRTNALAEADAARRLRRAEADRRHMEAGAQARAALFTNQVEAFRAAPTVYAQRAYLQTLVRGGASARKYVLATTNAQVIQFNLEEKLRPDLLDVPIPAPTRK